MEVVVVAVVLVAAAVVVVVVVDKGGDSSSIAAPRPKHMKAAVSWQLELAAQSPEPLIGS